MTNSATAYVLIRTDAGKESHVMKELRHLEGISKATIVSGDWDIVVEITDKSIDEILSIVANRIRQILNVKETKTLLGTKSSIHT